MSCLGENWALEFGKAFGPMIAGVVTAVAAILIGRRQSNATLEAVNRTLMADRRMKRLEMMRDPLMDLLSQLHFRVNAASKYGEANLLHAIASLDLLLGSSAADRQLKEALREIEKAVQSMQRGKDYIQEVRSYGAAAIQQDL